MNCKYCSEPMVKEQNRYFHSKTGQFHCRFSFEEVL